MIEEVEILEASRILHLAPGTIYNRIGEIPHTKLGKKLMFNPKALERYNDTRRS